MIKRVLFFLFSLLVGLALFGWILNHVGWENIKLALGRFSFQAGLLILLLTVLSALVRSYRWGTILKSQQYHVPLLRIFEYYLSGVSIAFFFPMVIFGGEIFRGYDLKEKYAIPWFKSIASVIIDKILEITVYIAAAAFGIAFFILKVAFIPAKFYFIVFLGTLLIVVLLGVLYFKIIKKESIIRFFLKKLNAKNFNGADTAIEVEKEIFRYFTLKNRKTLWKGIALSILHELILLGRASLLLLFLGQEISVFSIVSIVAFSSLAVLIPIPAALGSHEAVQSFIFNSLGLGTDIAMAFVFIIRGVELALALLGAVFFFKFGVQILQSAVLKRIARLIGK
ncbi:MAG: lysylphosphatidylglycerol synthase transmembrane domain-containing protein [Patescibacteria group bacterium]